ncbi:DUF6221 family protein [Streptomyces sp. NPDC004082]
MDELVRWLGEQLDEDERIARAATPGPWWHNPGKQWLGPEAFETYDLRQGEEFVGYGGPHPFTGAVASTGPASNMQGMKDAAFIAEHDPARVLREIDAKRDLLRFAAGVHDHHETFTTGVSARLDGTLRLFALAYADRPGYRNEWKP